MRGVARVLTLLALWAGAEAAMAPSVVSPTAALVVAVAVALVVIPLDPIFRRTR